MTDTTQILDALKGKVSVDSTITVKGWIRSKRDSKAGISFLAVNDGSSFDSIQAVVPSELANYESEVLKITTGAGVEVTGTLVESQGKDLSVEIQATEVTIVGWVDDPETYPIAKKRHTFEYLRQVAHPKTTHQYIRCHHSRQNHVSQRHPQLLLQQRFSFGSTRLSSRPQIVRALEGCSVSAH